MNSLLYSTSRMKIETKDLLLPNGNERTYLFVQPVDAVCILPVDEKYVYLIRQYRAIIDSYILEIPAGGMDHPGESKEEAARRELAEEARMKAEEIIPHGFVYSSPGFCTEKLWLFEARGLSRCEEFPMDDDEIIEPIKIRKDEVFSLIRSGEISDSKTIALLTRVLTH